MTKKKKILILHTGGTIGMIPGKVPGTLTPGDTGKHFLKLVPQLRELARVEVKVVANLDSSNVTPRHWREWIDVLRSQYIHYDGFVITHGTDTMAYTGAALSFSLRQTGKPIILTGSQRPLSHIRTDARDNLINSVALACDGPKEVSICFGNELLRANRSTKLSASDYIAFQSFSFSHLAKVGVQIDCHWKNLAPVNRVKEGKPLWLNSFNPHVFCLKIFPGISGDILAATISSDSCHGVVLEAFGAGNVPSLDESVLDMIKLAQKLEKPVVIVSQCPHGLVDLDMYETGIKAKEAGAISAGDMTSEASVVKLMHALGMKLKGPALKTYLLKNICGERKGT